MKKPFLGRDIPKLESILRDSEHLAVPSNPGKKPGTGPNLGEVFDEYEKTSIDFSNMGDAELNEYLYKTGLQNVFNDYQQNIETLSQSKKQSLEDAYYIRELSKKYLGKKASNIGLGNVSGNLLDIYSDYQRSISDITTNYAALELNLDREFQVKRAEEYNKIIQAQHNMKLEEMNDIAQEVMFNISSGKTSDMTDFEYLESRRGEIDAETYQILYSTLYSGLVADINSNLETGFFGVKTDEEGNQVNITNPREYVERYKGILSKRDFDNLIEQITHNEIKAAEMAELTKVKQRTDINFEYFGPTDAKIDENIVYEFLGQQHARVLDTVENDKDTKLDSESLFAMFEYKEGRQANSNDVFEHNNVFYMLKGSNWHRLISRTGSTLIEENEISWVANDTGVSEDGAYQTNGRRRDTLTVNGITYIEEDGFRLTNNKFTLDDKKDDDYNPALVELFRKTHPDGNGNIKRNSVVFFEGHFWVYNENKRFSIMVRK